MEQLLKELLEELKKNNLLIEEQLAPRRESIRRQEEARKFIEEQHQRVRILQEKYKNGFTNDNNLNS
jgi:hypothetical protein